MVLRDVEAGAVAKLRESGVDSMVNDGYRLRDAALARMGRVQLLFGGGSATARAGHEALKQYSVALAVIEDASPLDEYDVEVAVDALKRSTLKSQDFNDEARLAIKRASWKD